MWFYLHNNKQYGPVSLEQLQDLALMGQLHPNDRVAKAGIQEWVAASSLPGLFVSSGPKLTYQGKSNKAASAILALTLGGVALLSVCVVLLVAVFWGNQGPSHAASKRPIIATSTPIHFKKQDSTKPQKKDPASTPEPDHPDISQRGKSSPINLERKGDAPTQPTNLKPENLKPINVEKLPLLQRGDLNYVGAFRLPQTKSGVSWFSYGGTALAFGPKNNTLFLVGHDHHQAVAEIQIPKTIVKSNRIQNLPTAKVRQPFTKIIPRIPHYKLTGNPKIGGLLVHNEKLLGTVYIYYDASGRARESHFSLDSTKLASAKVEGLFQIGDLGAGVVAGYMGQIPKAWQAKFGAPLLTGQAGIPIVSRTSAGPAAFAFDPQNFGSKTVSAQPLVYYPLAKCLANLSSKNPLYNHTSHVEGVIFPDGSRSVLFFGSHGLGDYWYGESKGKDKAKPSRGGHAPPYVTQVWAYDALDFFAVKNGKKRPWAVKPFASWKLTLPISSSVFLGGVAFDQKNGLIYVSQLGGEQLQFSSLPLIHVFKLQPRQH